MKETKTLKRCDKGHFYDSGRFDTCPHCQKTDDISRTILSPSVDIFSSSQAPTTPAESVTEGNNQVRCARGHYYNAARYDACPHCKRMDENDDIPFTILGGVSDGSFSGTVQSTGSSQPAVQKQDDSVTMHFYKKTFGTEPVVGWLVCVGGKESMHFGQDFRLKDGRNFIGRDGDMDICLNGDLTISRKKHAIVTYDRKGNSFFVQPGESSQLCYLNDKPLLQATAFSAGDRLTVGETELVFVPFCGDTFVWDK